MTIAQEIAIPARSRGALAGYNRMVGAGNWSTFVANQASGPNGLWLIPFKTTRTPNGTVDSYHEYDQVIVSTQPIACPQV